VDINVDVDVDVDAKFHFPRLPKRRGEMREQKK
jgi:hypothetical protein